jgi:hypothetical protein
VSPAGRKAANVFEVKTVESSSLKTVGYDPETRELEILFCSLKVYRYDGVPPEIANGLLNAKSKGLYLAENIRGRFSYKCLNPTPKEPNNAAKHHEVESKNLSRPKALQKRKTFPRI